MVGLCVIIETYKYLNHIHFTQVTIYDLSLCL